MLLWLSACAFHVPSPTGDALPLALAARADDPGRPYATVEGRAWFVDTAATRTTCDDDFVASLGAKVTPTRARSVGEAGSVELGRAVLRDVVIGGWRFARLPCAVRDLGTTSSIPENPGDPVAGILGANLFRHFAVAFDFPAETLTLRRERTKAGARLRREGVVGPRLVAALLVDGVAVDAVVDTGADQTYLPLTTGPVKLSYSAMRRGTGPGGSIAVTVVVRGIEAATVDGAAIPLTQYMEREGDAGLLGMDALGQGRLVVDFRGRRLLIEPSARAATYVSP